jgi:hypothetical protein
VLLALLLAGCEGSDAPIGMSQSALTSLQATAQVQAVCHGSYRNHGQCMKCVTHVLNDLKWEAVIESPIQGEVTSWFAHHWCDGDPCIPTTCAVANAYCGEISDDCGGGLDCGTCEPPLVCGGGGISHLCGRRTSTTVGDAPR